MNKGILQNKKNLLAFSGGVDSSALFFMLLENDIEFDIAIVDYGLRESSKDEVAYANELAVKYNKICHHTQAPKYESNLEKNMRDFRYNFFDTLMRDYDNLLTAHHLNDRFEWFLMQLSCGAGLLELMGFDEISQRKNYHIIRPLVHTSREEIVEYLHKNNIKYFEDESNGDTQFERNYIRANFSTKFINEYKEGVKKSFEYLQKDRSLFEQSYQKTEQLYIVDTKDDLINIRTIDKILKIEGLLLSSAQKQEILDTKDCVVAGKFAICFTDDKIYIAPYHKEAMPKEFKEKCRVANIPPKVRGYIYAQDLLTQLLERS
jgi:tRNA(Ile)-lysidine synthase